MFDNVYYMHAHASILASQEKKCFGTIKCFSDLPTLIFIRMEPETHN